MEEQDLLLAVIANNYKAVAKHCNDKRMLEATDYMGFTPLELARLLNLKECLKLLEPNRPEKNFYINGRRIGLAEYEETFKIRYMAYPFFFNYSFLEHVVKSCPWTLKLGGRSEELNDNYKKFEWEISEAYAAPIEMRWIDEKIGWGVFARDHIPEGEFIIQYTGMVAPITLEKLSLTPYSMSYFHSNYSFRKYVINSSTAGNESRFINHSSRTNLEFASALDRGLIHTFLVTQRNITKGEQLLYDYGNEYWLFREKPQDL